jgi:hypothetical protein
MAKRYNSKMGLEIIIPVVLVLVLTGVLAASGGAWLVIPINAVVLAFVFILFRGTYYIINGNQLIIKAGFLFNKTLEISEVTKITETYNPLSAPAASLDRLEIKSNKTYELISPKDKDGFIAEMVSLNPKIEVKRRKP